MARITRKQVTVFLSVIGVGMVAFAGTLLETALNVTFPTLMTTFGVPLRAIQWVTTGYLLTSSWMMMLTAPLERRVAVRRLFGWGAGLFLASLVGCAVAPTFGVLLIGRLACGVATGICIPLLFLVIETTCPPAQLGFFMAGGTVITALAPTFGPIYGGLVLQTGNWRCVFWLLIPIVILGMILAFPWLSQRIQQGRTPFDWWSFVLAMLLCGLGLLLANNLFRLKWFVGSSCGCGLVIILGWQWARHHRLFIDNQLFRVTHFSREFSLFFAVQMVNVALGGFVLPNYLQLSAGQSAFTVGLLLLPGLLCRVSLMPLAGRYYDRHKPAPVKEGLVIFASTLVLLAGCIYWRKPRGIIAAVYCCYNAGLALVLGNLMTHAYQLVPAEMGPDANAVLNTAQQYSGAVGIAAASSWLTGAAHCAGQYGNVVGIMAIVGLLIWANWTRLVSRK